MGGIRVNNNYYYYLTYSAVVIFPNPIQLPPLYSSLLIKLYGRMRSHFFLIAVCRYKKKNRRNVVWCHGTAEIAHENVAARIMDLAHIKSRCQRQWVEFNDITTIMAVSITAAVGSYTRIYIYDTLRLNRRKTTERRRIKDR